MGGLHVSPVTVRQNCRSQSKPPKAHHLQSRKMNPTLVDFFLISSWKKKENGCFWAAREQERQSWSHPGNAPDIHLCSCSENFRCERLAKIFSDGSCWEIISLMTQILLKQLSAVQVHRRQWWERLRCASQVERLSGLRRVVTCKLHKFSLERKRNNHWSMKIQEPSEREIFLLENATEELAGWQKMSELHCFQHRKVYEQDRGPVRMPRL